MSVRVLHFDVFTEHSGKGNPAGVVLAADDMTDGDMQSIAMASGYPDTVFLSSAPEADVRARYFSPRRETELCGHATIAASIAMYARGTLAGRALPLAFSVATSVGILPIRIEMSASGKLLVVMTQARSQLMTFGGDHEKLARVLGLTRADLHPALPVVYGSTGRWTLIVPTRSREVMGRMVPQPQHFAEVLAQIPDASIHPFCLDCLGAGVHMHARHFSSPASGIVEDPVTGTASGVLGAYYKTHVANGPVGQPLVVEQGCEIGREGRVLVWADRDDGDSYSVRIGGTACFVEELLFSTPRAGSQPQRTGQ